MDRQNLPATTQTDIVVYQGDAGLKMTVKTDGETVWLTQEQMSNLFGRDQSVIVRHIGNIFKEKELVKDSVYAKFAYTASDHKVYQVAFYNLPDLRGDILQYFLESRI